MGDPTTSCVSLESHGQNVMATSTAIENGQWLHALASCEKLHPLLECDTCPAHPGQRILSFVLMEVRRHLLAV
jgi:hypothetical protein